jgi:UDP:flavonoid glycosyltransferase YjiC (YdhE family)
VGHHGGHGTTAAAMVHHVLLIYMSFVRELYVKHTFPPNKIL